MRVLLEEMIGKIMYKWMYGSLELIRKSDIYEIFSAVYY